MTTSTTGVKQILSLDLRSLALYRILLGVILLIDAINHILLVPAFYSDSGIVPRFMVDLGPYEYAYYFQLMMLSGSEWYSYLFLGILVSLSLLLIVGYRTRLVTFFCWLLLCSLCIRNGVILHAGDTLLTLLLFWGVFLPLNRTFSIDALKEDYKLSSYRHFSSVSIGLYIQFALVYIMTGLYKGQYITWLDGTHLYNTLSRFEFIKPFALNIYSFYDLLSFLTHFSLVLELFGPLLFFIPIGFVFFRMIGIVFFLGLQLSILLTLNVGLFPLISITGILVFLPTEFWGRIIKKKVRKDLKNIEWQNCKKKRSYSIPNILSESCITIVIVYIVIWNINGYSSKIDLPKSLRIPGYYLKLDQRWTMFSSYEKKSQYFSVFATYSDESVVDLMSELKTNSKALGDMRYAKYNNYRWRIFCANRLVDSDYFEFMPTFINYLVEKYGYEESAEKSLERVDIIPHMHYIDDYYNLTPLQTDIVYTMRFDD